MSPSSAFAGDPNTDTTTLPKPRTQTLQSYGPSPVSAVPTPCDTHSPVYPVSLWSQNPSFTTSVPTFTFPRGPPRRLVRSPSVSVPALQVTTPDGTGPVAGPLRGPTSGLWGLTEEHQGTSPHPTGEDSRVPPSVPGRLRGRDWGHVRPDTQTCGGPEVVGVGDRSRQVGVGWEERVAKGGSCRDWGGVGPWVTSSGRHPVSPRRRWTPKTPLHLRSRGPSPVGRRHRQPAPDKDSSTTNSVLRLPLPRLSRRCRRLGRLRNVRDSRPHRPWIAHVDPRLPCSSSEPSRCRRTKDRRQVGPADYSLKVWTDSRAVGRTTSVRPRVVVY